MTQPTIPKKSSIWICILICHFGCHSETSFQGKQDKRDDKFKAAVDENSGEAKPESPASVHITANGRDDELTVAKDSLVELVWKGQEVTDCTLLPLGKMVPNQATQDVTVKKTTKYAIECLAGQRPLVASVKVFVDQPPEPEVQPPNPPVAQEPPVIPPPAPTPPPQPEPTPEVTIEPPEPKKPVIIPEQCLAKVKALPEAPKAMVELFHWQASGDQAHFKQVISTPMVALLEPGATVPTIIALAFEKCHWHRSGRVYAIAGDTGVQKWVSTVDARPSIPAAIGDVDGDGQNEIIVAGADYKTYSLDHRGKIEWVSQQKNWPDAYYIDTGPALADLDLDGVVEVITASGVLNGKDGKQRYAFPMQKSFAVYDVDKQPGLEIVGSQGVFHGHDGQAKCVFKNEITNIAVAYLKKNDTLPTIIGTTGSGTGVGGFSSATCQPVFSNTFPGFGGGPYNVADFDGDGQLEFASAGSKRFAAFETNGNHMWEAPIRDFSSSRTGATTFDFNGDGKNEIVYNDEDYLRVFDGTGKILYETENTSWTWVEYPVIADVNADGHANIIVGANSCGSHEIKGPRKEGVRVFGAPHNDWVGTRKIWNQHAYYGFNVTETGSLTGVDREKIYQPWLEDAYLLGFRNNVAKRPVLDKPECKASAN